MLYQQEPTTDIHVLEATQEQPLQKQKEDISFLLRLKNLLICSFIYSPFSYHRQLQLISRQEGYILFDTGYSTDIYNIGWKGKLYNLLNPTYVKEGDQINIQLEKENIKCSEIKYLILSHLCSENYIKRSTSILIFPLL